MIRFLRGNIIDKDEKSITIDVSGVGYLVYLGANTLINTGEAGDSIQIYTYTSVKEDAIDLYGFMQKSELALFEMMLTVSGVGPKGALGIVSSEPIENLKKAIANSDSAYLTKFSGIGKKTAEKIVIELRDKLSNLVEKEYGQNVSGYDDVYLALESLGYDKREIRDVLTQIDRDIDDTGMIIKEAIKWLSQG
ncbi:Holliday junction branch migration protein RuvA [Candidatus Nomurabacteria bacterium]|nr:Holliday junction branch migration protein RuvA [Candidatus Nomurabacteria bacterium]MCB9820478.1 Holliday junction branch migration protein RuvA [Candidatus Nomurabacteria bacterium]